MAYKRRRTSKRLTKRRRTVGSRIKSARIAAARRRSMCLKPEVKYKTIPIDDFVVMNLERASGTVYGGLEVPTLTNMTNVTTTQNASIFWTLAQGTSNSERLGDQIHLKQVTLKGILYAVVRTHDSNVTNYPTMVRIMLVGLKQININNTSSQGNIQKVFGNIDPPIQLVKFLDRTDVNVYIDRTYSMTPTTGAPAVDSQPQICAIKKINLKYKFNRPVLFENGSATNAMPKKPRDNLFWLCLGYRYGLPDTQTVAIFTGQTRYYFSDA